MYYVYGFLGCYPLLRFLFIITDVFFFKTRFLHSEVC